MQKVIKIFLASSLVELASERMEIENFIHNLSAKYEEKYQIKLQPLLCEHFDSAIVAGRKQEEYNEMIRGCDFCFFIFFTKVGEYTAEEFKVAYEQFSKTSKPKIYTYFKELSTDEAEQSLRDFMEMLDKTLGHYYNTFSHLDTLKLRVLLSINLLEMDFVHIETKHNACLIDGEAVLNLDNVAEFYNNKGLQEILKKIADAEKQCAALKQSDDINAYTDALCKHKYLLQEAERLRKQIFDFSLGIMRDTVYGTVTARQLNAFGCLEKGDLQGALNALHIDDIKNEFLQEQKQIEEAKKASLFKFLGEIKTRIRVLALAYDYKKRFTDMEEAFLSAIPYVLQEKVELDIITAYMEFLELVKEDYTTAAQMGEKLLEIYSENSVGELTRLELYEKLAYIYGKLSTPKKVEFYHLRELETFEKLYSVDNLRYAAALIEKYRGIAAENSKKKHKKYLLKACAVCEHLFKFKPLDFADELLDVYDELALLYSICKAYGKSEKLYLKAIAIYEDLQIKEPHVIHQTMVGILGNLTSLYQRKKRFVKKEAAVLKKSIDLLEKIENGSLVAMCKVWRPNIKAFKEVTSWDLPLSIVPKIEAVDDQPLSPDNFAFALAVAYRDYGFAVGKTREYWKKAYALAMRYSNVDECARLASELEYWIKSYD